MNAETTIQILATAAGTGDNGAAAAFTDAVTEEGGQSGFCGFYPEMGEAKPVAHMEASLSHYGRHYFVYTPLELKGRGIEAQGKFNGIPGSRKNGWNVYKVTLKAMDKLEAQYRVASEMLL